MARIEKRNGSYTTRVSLTDPVTGKRVQPRVTAHTRRELDAAVANLRAQWNAGGWVEPATITVGEAVTAWLERTPRRPSTGIVYGNAARYIHADEIARVPLGRLQRHHVVAFVDRLQFAKLAPSYIRTIHATLSGALAQLHDRGVIPANPAARVKLPPIPQRRPPALTLEQSRTLIAGVRDAPHEAFWVLAVVLGIRRGELAALRWSDYDERAGLLRIERTWTRERVDGHDRYIIGDEPKSPASRRQLQVPLVAQAALARHRARVGEVSGEALMFDAGSPGAWSDRWRPLRSRLGLPDHVPLHGLRHTAATVMIEAGIPVTTVARILGHADATITLRVYAAVFEDMERRATTLLDGVYGDDRAHIVPIRASQS